jgi:hypothetical protein
MDSHRLQEAVAIGMDIGAGREFASPTDATLRRFNQGLGLGAGWLACLADASLQAERASVASRRRPRLQKQRARHRCRALAPTLTGNREDSLQPRARSPRCRGCCPPNPPRRRLRRWWSRSWIRWPRRWCCRQARRGSPPSSTALGLLLCLCSALLPRCCPLKVMGWQVMGWIVPPRRRRLRQGMQQRSVGSCTWGVSWTLPPGNHSTGRPAFHNNQSFLSQAERRFCIVVPRALMSAIAHRRPAPLRRRRRETLRLTVRSAGRNEAYAPADPSPIGERCTGPVSR